MKKVINEGETYNKNEHLDGEKTVHNNSKEITLDKLQESIAKNAKITIKYVEKNNDDQDDDNDIFNMFSI